MKHTDNFTFAVFLVRFVVKNHPSMKALLIAKDFNRRK